jgi:hypothetical protein
MYAAVHSDRSGRVFISADYRAAAHDGMEHGGLDAAIPIPPGASLIPIDREAVALDRAGRPRPLGRTRWALAALLPATHTRTHFPAYADETEPLAALPYGAVAADSAGELVVAAVESGARREDPSGIDARAAGVALQRRPANRLVRQLARCARDHRCAAAAAALAGHGDGSLPLRAESNESPPTFVSLLRRPAEAPLEPARFRPSAAEVAEVALDHLARGGERVSFGPACDGEPLLSIRVLEEAVRRIRAGSSAPIHLETNASLAGALRRAIEAGVSSVTVRLASALPASYDALHGPAGYRWADVGAGLEEAVRGRVALRLALLVLPGLTDRLEEIEGTIELLAQTRAGLDLRDLAADPPRALALLPRGGMPVGIAAAVARLRAEADALGISGTSAAINPLD